MLPVYGGRIPARAEAKARLGLPGDSFCLGYLGTVYERYDFATMLGAMAACMDHIPRLYFLIVGSGPGLEEVKRRAAALGLAAFSPLRNLPGFSRPWTWDSCL